MMNELTKDAIVTSLENLIAGFCVFEFNSFTEDLDLIYFNEGLCRMLGYSKKQLLRYTKKIKTYLIPEDEPKVKQGIKDILKDDGSVAFNFRTVTGNGSVRWLEAHCNLSAREGDIYTLVAIILDVTEAQNVKEELQKQAERMSIISHAEHEQIIDYNAKTDVALFHDSNDVNSTNETIINRYFAEFDASNFHPDDVENFLMSFETALKSPTHIVMDFRSKRFKEEDDFKWYRLNMTSILGVEGYVSRVVGRVINVDEQKKKEMEIEKRADLDALTKVLNKPAAIESITNIVCDDEQFGNKLNALFILDMDNFKAINDEYGHEAADRVLIKVADTLKDNFKGQDVIGRLGGDEFIVFVRNLNSIEDIDSIAYKLCNDIVIPLSENENSLNISFTIGIALAKTKGESYQNIFEKADNALLQAKANGKSGYRIYDLAEEVNSEINNQSRLYTESEIKIHTPEEILINIIEHEKTKENAIMLSLEMLCKRYGFESAYLAKMNSEMCLSKERIFYNIEGYENDIESEEHKKLRNQCCRSLYQVYHNFVCINDIGLCDECVQQLMTEDNIIRVFFYPLTHKDQLEGAIVFGNHTEDGKAFTEADYGELRLVLRLLDAYVLQFDLFPAVKKIIPNISTLDNLEQFIYIIDADTHKIIFINKKVILETPEIKIGDYCYSVLRSSETPCGDCLISKMDKKDPYCHFEQESFNYSTRCWMRITISWLGNPLENNAIMISGFDISDYLTAK